MSAPHSATLTNKPPDQRDEWLTAFVAECRGWFSQRGVHLPPTVHIVSGWGYAEGGVRHAEAPHIQAHMVSGTRTVDGAPVVFVSPVVDDVWRVAAYVVHQLIHAALDPELQHPKAFREAARAVDLAGPPTVPALGPDLRELVGEFIADRGDYPPTPLGLLAAPVIPGRTSTAPAPQSDRYLAARCPVCPGHRSKHRTLKLSRRAAAEGTPLCGRILVPAVIDHDGTVLAPAVRCEQVTLLDEQFTAVSAG